MLDKILGFIANTLNYEVVPVTLTNGYTLASWGYIKAYRFGYICMLTFSGLKRSTATTSNTQFASIPFTVMENMTTSAIDGGSDTAIVQAMKGTSEIYINAANANANYFGQLIFIVGGVLLNPHFSTFTAVLQKIGGGLDVGQDISIYPLRNGIRVQSPHKLFDRHKHYDQPETIQTRRFGCSNILLNEQLEVYCLDVRSSGQFDKLKDLNTVQQLQRTDRNERDRRYRISDLCWLQNDITTHYRGWAVC